MNGSETNLKRAPSSGPKSSGPPQPQSPQQRSHTAPSPTKLQSSENSESSSNRKFSHSRKSNNTSPNTTNFNKTRPATTSSAAPISSSTNSTVPTTDAIAANKPEGSPVPVELSQIFSNKLDNIIGVTIQLKTILSDETISGEIFCFDPQLNLLVIYESVGQHATSTRKSFRVVNTRTITEILVFDISSVKTTSIPFKDLTTPLPPINIENVKEREEQAIYKRKAHLGEGVTVFGQTVFDYMAKIIHCRWGKDGVIIVSPGHGSHDDYFIKPPYTVQDVSGPNEASIIQIRKMLQRQNLSK